MKIEILENLYLPLWACSLPKLNDFLDEISGDINECDF